MCERESEWCWVAFVTDGDGEAGIKRRVLAGSVVHAAFGAH